MTLTTTCLDCGSTVRFADLLVRRSPGNVDRRLVLIDPETVPATISQPEQLLLCLGKRYGAGSAVVVPLDDPGAPKLARVIPEPHAHRLHVCSAVPAAWAAEHTRVLR
jgi:hypothetical protein